MKQILVLFVLISMLLFSQSVVAVNGATPTAAQIEQFKKLPRAQQEALARQYGFDLDEIMGNKSQQKNSGDLGLNEPLSSDDNEENKKTAEELEEERYKPEPEELEVFGSSFFDSESLGEARQRGLYTPISLPDSYVVGPGDQFIVSFYGKQSAQYELEVDRAGRLIIPELSPVQVSGLSYKAMKNIIKNKISSEMIGVDVYITAGELKSTPVLVLGEVEQPGRHVVPSLASVTDVLVEAGGITDIGSMRNITIKRNGETTTTFDLYELLLNGDDSSDITLKPKDIILIPPVGPQISVDGLVKRPAIFELKEKENLKSLIDMAGGAKPNGNLSKVLVERYTSSGLKTVLQVDLLSGDKPFFLEDGDEVNVTRTNNELTDAVTLIGAVSQPGNYSWRDGFTIKDIITSLKSDVLSIADFNYSLILREKDQTGQVDVLQFSLSEVFAGTDSVKLQPRDVIVVFSRFNDKEEESKSIRSLAFSTDELDLKEKEEQWQDYKNRKFEEFIGVRDPFEEALKESEKQLETQALDEILRGKEEEVDDEQLTAFGRQKLLQPIIRMLTEQASVKSKAKVVAISGKVKYPGVYPLPIGGNIKDLVQAAGGLHESAYIESAELTRFESGQGATLSHFNIDLAEALSSPNNKEFKLNSKDSLNIFVTPNWQEKRVVTLLGEFNFPGTYRIRRGETLKNLIERAGGMTEYAYPNGAVYTREVIRKQEKEQLKRLQEDLRREIASKSLQKSVTDSSMSYSEMSKLLDDLGDVDALGRLVIDLPRVLTGQQNIELQNRDAIYLPPKQNTISVVGEVNQSASHLFEDNLSIEDYINRSGGVRQRADLDGLYVIKANGSVEVPEAGNWFAVANASTELQPGDTIVVPLDADYTDNLTLWSTATQILYQLGVAVAAIGSL
ncbi:SLBB domain-containing protein [Pseudoalteromonas sp. CO325X]|uniref:SLBB domain-containing protein n=1 Tax=Pseudoalteromonas sp. CO325X TaxID=1777262 RepID=UPI001F113ABE|nr:SLBB domain-containing protein [Pseudoalteromonas sp. CO325X]